MVAIDERWDRMKALRAAGFASHAGQPDLDPAHEMLQLAESFGELIRLKETSARGPAFVRRVEEAERQAAVLQAALREFKNGPTALAREAAVTAFTQVGKLHVLPRGPSRQGRRPLGEAGCRPGHHSPTWQEWPRV